MKAFKKILASTMAVMVLAVSAVSVVASAQEPFSMTTSYAVLANVFTPQRPRYGIVSINAYHNTTGSRAASATSERSLAINDIIVAKLSSCYDDTKRYYYIGDGTLYNGSSVQSGSAVSCSLRYG